MPVATSNMSQPDPQRGNGTDGPDTSEAKSETRIDRAHVISATDSPTSPTETADGSQAGAPDLDDAADSALGLRNQADELAAYLRSRLKDLDHRESILNARSAQFDASLRNAQAELNERQVELAEREQKLVEREREVESRSQTLSSEENQVRSGSLERRSERLNRREASLATLREDLDRAHAQALDMCIAAQKAFQEISTGSDRTALADSANRVHDLSHEYYRTQNQELAEKKRQLEDIRRQLADESQRLQDHEKQLRQSARERELTMEARAAQIAAKEAKLRREQTAAENRV